MVFEHDEQTQWPRGPQHTDERFFDEAKDVRNSSVWSSMKWLSDEQPVKLTAVAGHAIDEQLMISWTTKKRIEIHFY